MDIFVAKYMRVVILAKDVIPVVMCVTVVAIPVVSVVMMEVVIQITTL